MRKDAHKIIKEIEESAYKDGHADGYKAGWTDAANAANEALKIQPARGATVSQHNGASTNPFRIGTRSASVYDYVKANPGKKGAEIIQALGVGTKIARTALYRMKDDGVAVNQDGWRLL
jgi:hypothetical protein